MILNPILDSCGKSLAVSLSDGLAEKVLGPPRLDSIHVELECPGAVEERDPKGLVEAVRKCLIHNTLLHAPNIRVDLVIPAARNAA